MTAMYFTVQSLTTQKKAASRLLQTLVGMAPQPKQYPACGSYGQRNANENSNGDELQHKEAVARWTATLQDSEPPRTIAESTPVTRTTKPVAAARRNLPRTLILTAPG